MHIDEVSGHVLDAAIKVHSALGPGLLESAYRTCLAYELSDRSLEVKCEMACPLQYKGVQIDLAYRIDLCVNDCVLVELKTVPKTLPVHQAQLLRTSG